MAKMDEKTRKEIAVSVAKWAEGKELSPDDQKTYRQFVSYIVDAVWQSLECSVVQEEVPVVQDAKPTKGDTWVIWLLPLVTAFMAFVGAKVWGSLGACFAVLFAAAGFSWWVSHKWAAKCEPREETPAPAVDWELGINGEKFDQTLAKIPFLHSASGKLQPAAKDLRTDEEFHRWLQQYALKVHRRGNYNDLQTLLALKVVLENYDLYLYDELEEDDDGNIVLPPLEDAYMDMREGEEWTAVAMPALYTSDKVLLCGVIK